MDLWRSPVRSTQQIEEMLASGIVGRMRRYHDLLWVNIGAQREQQPMAPDRRWSVQRSVDRCEQPSHSFSWGRVNCGDFEKLDDQRTDRHGPHPNAELAAEGVVQEGWVWVQPYWNPDQPVKVCAFDVEACRHQRNQRPAQVSCNTGLANRSSGDLWTNLRWCLT